jgi:predicted amidophosphoribosyltransferase
MGPWDAGFVLDRHMVVSLPVGFDGTRTIFDSTRTPLGEAVYRFKNKGGPADDIVDTAIAFIEKRWPVEIDTVVWPPPSRVRWRQPAEVLGRAVAERLGVTVVPDSLIKVQLTEQVKNLPQYERAAILESAMQRGPGSVRDRRVLLIDDLWQTGSTMRRSATVLREMGPASIRALAITRTR